MTFSFKILTKSRGIAVNKSVGNNVCFSKLVTNASNKACDDDDMRSDSDSLLFSSGRYSYKITAVNSNLIFTEPICVAGNGNFDTLLAIPF